MIAHFAPVARLLTSATRQEEPFQDIAGLAALGVPITDHDKLPDVFLNDERRRWLFLIEVVTFLTD